MVFAVIASIMSVLFIRTKSNIAFAEEPTNVEGTEEFIVSSLEDNVDATYEFIRLNDTDCSVRITNKQVATKAIIPSIGEINGKKYNVTEIAGSGFSASPNLVRVNLPDSLKKIGSSAFSNCAKLNRINLANVEEIGNSAFMRCPELTYLVIPKATKTIGTYILRNNNTQVKVRADVEGENWAENWNKSNANQTIEFCTGYRHPIELELMYDTHFRSERQVMGVSLASGQPRNDSFYTINEDNVDEFNVDNNYIYIPAVYKNPATQEELEILAIDEYAFSSAAVDQIIIGYSDSSLQLKNYAFAENKARNIIINRSIEVENNDTQLEADHIFASSENSSIILPNTLTKLTSYMFDDCKNLSNIFFMEPTSTETLSDLLKKTGSLKENEKAGIVSIAEKSQVTTIGDGAFKGTESIAELHLGKFIQTVGATILADWEDTQKVFVHNEGELVGWHEQWNSKFENIFYDTKVLTVKFDTKGGEFVNEEQSKHLTILVNKEGVTIENQLVNGELTMYLPNVSKDGYTLLSWNYNNVPLTSEILMSLRKGTIKEITLTANWKKNAATIVFMREGGQGGTGTAKANDDDTLPDGIKPPTRMGYKLLGYIQYGLGGDKNYFYTCNEAGDLIPNPDITISEVSIELFADWVPITYYITYKCDGFEDWPQNIMNPNIDEFSVENTTAQLTLKDPKRYDENVFFDGWWWEGKNKFITSLNGITENVTLVAMWTDAIKINISSPQGYQTISDEAVKLVLSNPSSRNTFTVNVTKTAENLIIVGNGGFYNMSINIENRNTPFILELRDITIQAPTGSYAIASGYSKLNLITRGIVKIRGSAASTVGTITDAPSGLPAIVCSSLFIQAADDLLIKGGNGLNGMMGFKGINNGDAQNGGNGAAAVCMFSECIIGCDNVTILAGYAGYGGNAYGSGYKGYGGRGALPIMTSRMDGFSSYVGIKENAKNVYLYQTIDGQDGSGKERPLFINPGNNNGTIIMPPDFSLELPPRDFEVDPGIGSGGILPSFP